MKRGISAKASIVRTTKLATYDYIQLQAVTHVVSDHMVYAHRTTML